MPSESLNQQSAIFLPFFHSLETLSLPIERPPIVLSIPLSPNSSPQSFLISSTLIFMISYPIDFIRYISKISCLFQFFFFCLIFVDYYALSLIYLITFKFVDFFLSKLEWSLYILHHFFLFHFCFSPFVFFSASIFRSVFRKIILSYNFILFYFNCFF